MLDLKKGIYFGGTGTPTGEKRESNVHISDQGYLMSNKEGKEC